MFSFLKKKKINERCRICVFYISQDCRKHAPISSHERPYSKNWPYMTWDDWCGDFKLDEENHKRFDLKE